MANAANYKILVHSSKCLEQGREQPKKPKRKNRRGKIKNKRKKSNDILIISNNMREDSPS